MLKHVPVSVRTIKIMRVKENHRPQKLKASMLMSYSCKYREIMIPHVGWRTKLAPSLFSPLIVWKTCNQMSAGQKEEHILWKWQWRIIPMHENRTLLWYQRICSSGGHIFAHLISLWWFVFEACRIFDLENLAKKGGDYKWALSKKAYYSSGLDCSWFEVVIYPGG